MARPIWFWLNGDSFMSPIVGLTNRFLRPTNRKENLMATMSAPTKPAQIGVARRSPAYWRVTIDNPPINVMGPEMVHQFQEVTDALEADEQIRVVVFDSAVDDYFLITPISWPSLSEEIEE
jgi:hypothetical protein